MGGSIGPVEILGIVLAAVVGFAIVVLGLADRGRLKQQALVDAMRWRIASLEREVSTLRGQALRAGQRFGRVEYSEVHEFTPEVREALAGRVRARVIPLAEYKWGHGYTSNDTQKG